MSHSGPPRIHKEPRGIFALSYRLSPRYSPVSCLKTECLAFWAPVSLNSAGSTPSQGELKLRLPESLSSHHHHIKHKLSSRPSHHHHTTHKLSLSPLLQQHQQMSCSVHQCLQRTIRRYPLSLHRILCNTHHCGLGDRVCSCQSSERFKQCWLRPFQRRIET